MIATPRILLVQDMSEGWQPALAALADNRLLDQTCVVRDDQEAMDFLHARGGFVRRPPGLPAVLLLGADLSPMRSLNVLEQIRSDPQLRYLPVVMITASPQPEVLRRAYELGVNGVVVKSDDPKVTAERLSAVWLFWALANVPPLGCLRQPAFEEREGP